MCGIHTNDECIKRKQGNWEIVGYEHEEYHLPSSYNVLYIPYIPQLPVGGYTTCGNMHVT